eukprot:376147-Rhodomonas_salina.2
MTRPRETTASATRNPTWSAASVSTPSQATLRFTCQFATAHDCGRTQACPTPLSNPKQLPTNCSQREARSADLAVGLLEGLFGAVEVPVLGLLLSVLQARRMRRLSTKSTRSLLAQRVTRRNVKGEAGGGRGGGGREKAGRRGKRREG